MRHARFDHSGPTLVAALAVLGVAMIALGRLIAPALEVPTAARPKRRRRRRRWLDVVISNAYAANRKRRRYRARLLRTGAPVLVITEAWWLGRLPGYRRHSATGGRHQRDTAIYTRLGVKVISKTARTLTKDVGGYAHARTVTEVRLRWRRHLWAVFAFHTNPGRNGRAEAQNRHLLAQLAELMRAAEADGYTPLAAGDGNRRMDEPHDADHPAHLAKVIGGVCRLIGIDGLVTTARVLRLRSLGTPPGADHPMLRARVTK